MMIIKQSITFFFIILISLSFVSAGVEINEEEPTTTGVIINQLINAGKTFLGLTDTPSSYSGQAGKCPVVNPGEDGLEFGACGGGGIGGNPFDQSLNTTDEVTFSEVNVTGWFNGLFNWTTLNDGWLSFTGSVLSFDETKLNQTIGSYTTNLTGSGAGFGDIFVNETGDTMTGNLILSDGVNITDESTTKIYFKDGVFIVEG